MQFSSFHFDSIFSESRKSLKPMMILNKMNIETACIRLLEIFRNLDTFVIPNIFGNFDLFRESQKFRDSVPISGKSSFPVSDATFSGSRTPLLFMHSISSFIAFFHSFHFPEFFTSSTFMGISSSVTIIAESLSFILFDLLKLFLFHSHFFLLVVYVPLLHVLFLLAFLPFSLLFLFVHYLANFYHFFLIYFIHVCTVFFWKLLKYPFLVIIRITWFTYISFNPIFSLQFFFFILIV